MELAIRNSSSPVRIYNHHDLPRFSHPWWQTEMVTDELEIMDYPATY
jgi:hypothetical protein